MTASGGNEPGSALAGLPVETVARVPVVAGWIVDGYSRPEMLAMAAERWATSTRGCDRLIAHARAELVAEWNVQRPELLATLLSRTDRIYKAAMACNNYGVALGAVNSAARLAQL